jgi:hypothetical protein
LKSGFDAATDLKLKKPYRFFFLIPGKNKVTLKALQKKARMLSLKCFEKDKDRACGA